MYFFLGFALLPREASTVKSKYYSLAKVVLMAVEKHGISIGMVFFKKKR